VLKPGDLFFAAFHFIHWLMLIWLKAQVDLLSLRDASTMYGQLPKSSIG